ncbi:MAG: leucine-rich repeat domain-containing protein [Eubacterium sp.]|nr:leucine-rich repeat domain-containing protein [Eubacterium sp.]
MLEKIYESREFSEDLDLSLHHDLLQKEDLTGPFLKITDEYDEPFVPDLSDEDRVDNPEIPSRFSLKATDEDDIPEEYISNIMTDEKKKDLSSGAKAEVCALLEYLGYESAGDYGNGSFTVYNHVSRVSFYSVDDGKMLAWMDTTDHRTGPMILKSDEYGLDGQRPILRYKDGSIWSTNAWTNALDQLFHDEDGYQVVGNRLVAVPEDLTTIRVPEGVTEIDAYVGRGHQATELILPEGLKKIGYSAFSLSKIEKVTIPDSVCYFDELFLEGSPWMKNARVDKYLIAGDSVLLRCFDESEEIKVPSNVKYIAPGAFNKLPCKRITIPSEVVECFNSHKDDEGAVISLCDQLEDLVIKGGLQNNVEGENIRLLTYCNNLKSIEVDAECEELPENWIELNSDHYSEVNMICPDNSPAADWADNKGIPHKENK